MRPVHPSPFAVAISTLAPVLVVVLLLAGVVPIPRAGATPPSVAPTPTGSLSSLEAQVAHQGSGLTSTPLGHVVESPLLNYNTSIRGNFGSSVWDWSIGPGTVVPSTRDIWLSDNLTQVYPGAPPSNAPAVIFDPYSNAFVGIVPQLANTSDLLFDPANGYVYSADPLNNTVGVFNPSGHSWVATIPVGKYPRALALDPSNNTLFVANSGSNNLSVIDTLTQQVVPTTITTGITPDSLAFSEINSAIFVACAGSRALYEVNASTYSISIVLHLIGNGAAVSVSQPTNTVAVTIPSHNFLTVLNATSIALVGAPVLGLGMTLVTSSPNGLYYVVANPSNDFVTTVNATSAMVAIATLPVGSGPVGLTPDNQTGFVYSWSSTYRNLTPVNSSSTASIQPSPTLGVRPGAVAYDPSANNVFVADSLTNSLLTLNSTTFEVGHSPVALPSQPYALADDSLTSTLYIGLAGGILAYDAATQQFLPQNRSVAGVNGALVVDAADGLLWDMNNLTGLSAYDIPSLTPALTTAVGPDTSAAGSLALDPVTDQLFAVTTGGLGSEVAVVGASTGSTINAGVAAGPGVTSVAFDPADGQVYALGVNLTMIDANTLNVASESIYLPTHSLLGASLTYEPSRQFIYATTSVSPGAVGEVTVIDGASVAAGYGSAGTIYLGYAPTALLSFDYPGASGVGSGVCCCGKSELWIPGSHRDLTGPD